MREMDSEKYYYYLGKIEKAVDVEEALRWLRRAESDRSLSEDDYAALENFCDDEVKEHSSEGKEESYSAYNDYMEQIKDARSISELTAISKQMPYNERLTEKEYQKLKLPYQKKYFILRDREEKFNKNPKEEATEIYGDILAIEAKKGKRSLWPNELFRHDFKKKGSKIFGLKDGSILIKPKKGKRLWKNFDY